MTKSSNAIESPRVFNICLGQLPDPIDPRSLRTAASYITIRQCSRSLTNYNQSGQLVGDLAERWQFSSDFKSVKFWIRDDAKWSDGTAVTATDLAYTLEWLKRSKKTVHFEMHLIEKIIIDEKTIELHFTKPMPNFLHSASHPEFSAYNIVNEEAVLTRTSGPFRILKTANYQELHLNKHYTQTSKPRPQAFRIVTSKSNEETSSLLENGHCDFAFVRNLPTEKESKIFADFKIHKHPIPIGFTFFASLNPNNLNIDERLLLSSIINKSAYDQRKSYPDFSHAKHLFLNDGPGRLTSQEIKSLWDKIDNSSKPDSLLKQPINILAPRNYWFGKMVRDTLESKGIKCRLVLYDTQDEYAQKIKSNQYDILINNNDYSSIDLAENLQVTFNSSRPLVSLGKFRPHFLELLSKLESASGDHRGELTRSIGQELISSGLVTPLFHMIYSIYLSKDLSADDFSRVGFEFSLHKLSIKNTHE
ncbi:MAG: ABC transporter substrate-binding protein [Bdellovibrionales bacterium]